MGWVCKKCGHGNLETWDKCKNCKSKKDTK